MSTEERPFRFFALPRELRDSIYDLLPRGRRLVYKTNNKDRSHFSREYAIRLFLGDRPISRFAMINKQFGDEYSRRAVTNTHLRIEDLMSSPIRNTEIPAVALGAHHITFRLVSCAPDYDQNVKEQVEFLKDVLRQMKKPHTFRLQLFFDHSPNREEEWSAKEVLEKYEASLEDVQGLVGMERIELLKGVPDVRDEYEGELEGTVLGSYTTAGGWDITVA